MGATTWSLLFKDKEKADEVYKNLDIVTVSGDPVQVEDQFGQRFTFKGASIDGIMYDDMSVSQLAYIERALHQARTQAKAQTRANTDPEMRGANAMHGPAVLRPFQ